MLLGAESEDDLRETHFVLETTLRALDEAAKDVEHSIANLRAISIA